MAKKKQIGIHITDAPIVGTYVASDFEQKVLALGATIVANTSFLNSGAQFVVGANNDNFLLDLELKTSVTSLDNERVSTIMHTIYHKVEVRKFGKDYYLVANDGWVVKTSVL
ncbi:MAG: hypothetical protein WCW93_03810 [Candidatus Paceibacterota bacterium]|jgi:hypothetical protein